MFSVLAVVRIAGLVDKSRGHLKIRHRILTALHKILPHLQFIPTRE